ncbi:hypothetical protein V8F33_013503 [Rhypophila sp. PSN 637]
MPSNQPKHSILLLSKLSRSGILLLYMALLLLAQNQIQPVQATPVPTESLKLFTRSATQLAKRSVFTTQEAVGLGSAIIIVVGVGIGLGCGLIAVCGFPWRLMCAKSRLSNKLSDEDKGKEVGPLGAGAAGQGLMAPPPLTPGSIPGPRQSAFSQGRPGTGSGGGGVMTGAAQSGSPSSSGPSLPVSAAMPVRSPLRYEYPTQGQTQRYQPVGVGRQQDDIMVEEQFHQQGAQPHGYI